MDTFMLWLRQQIPALNDPISSIVFWVVIAGIVFFLFTWGIPFFTRNTKTEIDDIIIGILRIPVTVILIVYGVLDVMRLAGQFKEWVEPAQKAFVLVVIWTLAWLGFRVIADIIKRYAEKYAEESESNLDDVLIPLVESAGPLLITVIALAATVWVFSPEFLGQLLTVVGALSFLLIFLFQEPLSNLFSGVYLWLGSPFKYGDLVILEDNKAYRVENIGSRVTRLYNTDDHTVAFIPNSKLAGQRLINVTRPNVELRYKMNIGIAYGTAADTVEHVQELVSNLTNTHVHTIGPWDKPAPRLRPKKELILKRIAELRNDGNKDDAEDLEREFQRLEVEYRLRDANQRIWSDLKSLAKEISELEYRGLDKKEKDHIRNQARNIRMRVYQMRRDLTIWVVWSGLLQGWYKLGIPPLRYQDIEESVINVEEWNKIEQSDPEKQMSELREKRKIPLIGTFNPDQELAASVLVLHALPQTAIAIDDFTALYHKWANPTRELLKRLTAIERVEKVRGEKEFQLDDFTLATAEKFSAKFMLGIPGFQFPDVDFTGFGESSLDFRLEFFVDDLVGDHFERLDDVFSDIGMAIKAQFDVKKIEIPFPQRDVWFRNELSQSGESKPKA